MKKSLQILLSFFLIFSIATPVFATSNHVAESNSTDRISRTTINTILRNHSVDASTISENNAFQLSADEISNLFSERSFAVMTGAPQEEISAIDQLLESCGYFDLTDEEVSLLLPSISTASFGPPSLPNDTKYVSFKMASGTTSTGIDYVNIIATSNWAPANGIYQSASLPLYNCKELNVYPSRSDYTLSFLKKSLEIIADEAAGLITNKLIPGIILAEFGKIAIEDFFRTGQSFGASAYAVTAQTVVFSYLANIPDYYTHYVTAEQCNELVVYYFAYNDGSGPDADMATNRTTFTSAYFSAPQVKAENKVLNNDLLRNVYSCGNIKVVYPTMEGTVETVTLSRVSYSDLYVIPGI